MSIFDFTAKTRVEFEIRYIFCIFFRIFLEYFTIDYFIKLELLSNIYISCDYIYITIPQMLVITDDLLNVTNVNARYSRNIDVIILILIYRNFFAD